MKRLVLGSASPRRQELLKYLNIPFEVIIKEVEESYPTGLIESEVAIYLAEKKANAFVEGLDDELVLTADTIVCHKDKVLGKPSDRYNAIEMLRELSDDEHSVITSCALLSSEGLSSFFSKTMVSFYKLSISEIHNYVDNFHPYDKAGAYGIQDWIGKVGIKEIRGCYYNVVGLPISTLKERLKSYDLIK